MVVVSDLAVLENDVKSNGYSSNVKLSHPNG